MSKKELRKRLANLEDFLGLAYIKYDENDNWSYHIVKQYGPMKYLIKYVEEEQIKEEKNRINKLK